MNQDLLKEFTPSKNDPWYNFLRVLRVYHFTWLIYYPSLNSMCHFAEWEWHMDKLGELNILTAGSPCEEG